MSIKLTILVSAALVIASHAGASSLADRKAAEASESEKVTERIQLQSEGFGIEYRDIVLEPASPL